MNINPDDVWHIELYRTFIFLLDGTSQRRTEPSWEPWKTISGISAVKLRLEDVGCQSGTETFFNRPPDFPDNTDPIS